LHAIHAIHVLHALQVSFDAFHAFVASRESGLRQAFNALDMGEGLRS
jgi:hypothetical protein